MNNKIKQIAHGLRSIAPKKPLFFLTADKNSLKNILGFQVYLIPEEYMQGFHCSKNGCYFDFMPVFDDEDFYSIEKFLESAMDYVEVV